MEARVKKIFERITGDVKPSEAFYEHYRKEFPVVRNSMVDSMKHPAYLLMINLLGLKYELVQKQLNKMIINGMPICLN